MNENEKIFILVEGEYDNSDELLEFDNPTLAAQKIKEIILHQINNLRENGFRKEEINIQGLLDGLTVIKGSKIKVSVEAIKITNIKIDNIEIEVE
jgi:hypothetical protein